jgi:hypothetical protein
MLAAWADRPRSRPAPGAAHRLAARAARDGQAAGAVAAARPTQQGRRAPAGTRGWPGREVALQRLQAEPQDASGPPAWRRAGAPCGRPCAAEAQVCEAYTPWFKGQAGRLQSARQAAPALSAPQRHSRWGGRAGAERAVRCRQWQPDGTGV